MTDEQRGTRERAEAGGYRGALTPRHDRLAAVWLAIVVVLFLLMFVLAFLDVPTRLFREETPPPVIPSPTIDVTPEPGDSPEPEAS